MNVELTRAVGANAVKAYEAASGKKPARQPDTKASLGVEREKVEISDSSASAKKVLDRIRVLPDVRIDLVSEIRARIKKNDYPLDNRLMQAAEKMLSGGVV